jgi:hypothetical protein
MSEQTERIDDLGVGELAAMCADRLVIDADARQLVCDLGVYLDIAGLVRPSELERDGLTLELVQKVVRLGGAHRRRYARPQHGRG